MDMSTGKKPHPTVAELFGLERIEGWHRPEDPPSLYCFRPAGLLPMEQILAVDAISGVTQVWTASSEKILVAETRLDLVETRLFTALVLSYPSSVARYQMRALCEMRDIVVVKEELERALQEQRGDAFMQPVEDLIAACNGKIRPLGMRIHRESGYVLTSDQQEPEQVIAQGDSHHARID